MCGDFLVLLISPLAQIMFYYISACRVAQIVHSEQDNMRHVMFRKLKCFYVSC